MEPWIVIVIAVAVLAIAALAWWASTRRRTTELRERFGPEYDRTVDASDDRRAAEAELAARRERREQLNIRPLDPASRQRYAQQWTDVQARFVDQPAASLAMADELVLIVMRERGYPMDDFDQRAADISVDHPQLVSHYRAAHDISNRVGTNAASTEDMRQALVHYRALFDELLNEGATDGVPQMPREAAR
jgi:FtsZ-interacting cell division protein ZipA